MGEAWDASVYMDDLYLKGFYSRAHNPESAWLYEYEKEGGKGKCLSSEYYQAQVAMWQDGYNIIEYYYTLCMDMIPALAKLFEEIQNLMDTLGSSGSIIYNDETIQTWASFKAIKDFLWDNYVPKAGNGTHLTLTFLALISLDESGLISQYNAYQDILNNNAEGKADSSKRGKEEPEKWIKKIDTDLKIKDLVKQHYPTTSFTHTSVPATSAPTTAMNYQKYYEDLYGSKNK